MARSHRHEIVYNFMPMPWISDISPCFNILHRIKYLTSIFYTNYDMNVTQWYWEIFPRSCLLSKHVWVTTTYIVLFYVYYSLSHTCVTLRFPIGGDGSPGGLCCRLFGLCDLTEPGILCVPCSPYSGFSRSSLSYVLWSTDRSSSWVPLAMGCLKDKYSNSLGTFVDNDYG